MNIRIRASEEYCGTLQWLTKLAPRHWVPFWKQWNSYAPHLLILVQNIILMTILTSRSQRKIACPVHHQGVCSNLARFYLLRVSCICCLAFLLLCCTAICLVYSSYNSRCHAHPLSIHIPSVVIPCFSTQMLFLCIIHQKGRGWLPNLKEHQQSPWKTWWCRRNQTAPHLYWLYNQWHKTRQL